MKSMLCALGGHEAAAAETYNSGYYFSRCRRCGRDMIRSGAAWHDVPRGHKVVWKPGRHSHSLEADYGPFLPVLHRDSNLPAVRSPYASWGRQLVQVAVPGLARTNGGGGGARAAVGEEEAEENLYPYLLAFAALVGAGLQLVMSVRAARDAF
jgi:hypothetical protein